MDGTLPTRTKTSQGYLSAVLLLAVVLTCVAVAIAAHETPVIANHVAREVERQRALDGKYFYNGGFVDDGDYVLVGQLPKTNYARGGVYFIGASETKNALRPWELPAAERALIHNYSLGDLRHRDVLHYVRSLVEEDGLLEAGGEKTTVVLGLSYQMTRGRDLSNVNDRYVPMLFERHGFYTYDVEDGIRRKPMSDVERFLQVERIRAQRFLQVLVSPPDDVSLERETPREGHDYLVAAMGENWRQEMERQVAYVAEVIDYLQARGAHVRVIFPPEASWHETLPFDDTYRALLKPVLEIRKVPSSDLKHLLRDTEFSDAVHARYTGEIKLHNAYRAIALQSLAAMGTELQPPRGS